MRWRRGADQGAPADVVAAAGLDRGEKVLAAARELGAAGWGADGVTTSEAASGVWVLLTSWRVVVVAHGAVVLDRPWLEVDAGRWDPETGTLTVHWVDRTGSTRWRFSDDASTRALADRFWERVAASVVLIREVDLGPRRRTRVVIRKRLDDRSLVEQVIPGRGVDPGDADLASTVLAARVDLRDQVGLGPIEG